MLDLEKIAQYSEMVEPERKFVLETIKKHKPKKILSIGIAAGSNEVIILNLLEQENLLESTKLFSIDYHSTYYRDLSDKTKNQRKTGFLVDECIPHLKEYFTLYTGGISANHIEKVGDGIDLCIIDTVHSAPGELLDLLVALPFLSENAVIIFHDLVFQCFYGKHSNICALCFLLLKGNKTYPKPYIWTPYTNDYNKFLNTSKELCQNIGACELDKDFLTENKLNDLFKAFLFPWCYMPCYEDIEIFKEFIKKYYAQKYLNSFEEMLKIQRIWNNEALTHNNYLQNEISKVKSQLSYQLGQALIKNPLFFPFKAFKIYRKWRKDKKC